MSGESLALPAFSLAKINKREYGWGPHDIPEEFKNMPYQPFSKDTRLGKVADWSGNIYQDVKSKNRYTSQFGGGGQYAYYHDEDDVNFLTATAVKTNKNSYLKNRQRFNLRRQRGGGAYGNRAYGTQQAAGQPASRKADARGQQPPRTRQNLAWQSRRGNYRQDYRNKPNRSNRAPSIQIKDNWPAFDEVELSRLSKLSQPNVGKPLDIADYGVVGYYNPDYDNVNTKNETPLRRIEVPLFTVSTSDDPVILELAKTGLGNVFMTSSIACTLMCCPRSVISWDIVATRFADQLFLDFRHSDFVHLTVAETAQDPPNDDVSDCNSAKKLAMEASGVNLFLTNQVLKQDRKMYSFPNPTPFVNSDAEDEAAAAAPGEKKPACSIGYRYRMFDLGNNIHCVIRCEVDAAIPEKSKKKHFACVYALTEYPVKSTGAVDFRAKLDTQRGAVLASELKNNACKLAKWTTRALLSGADQMKLAFVSRVSPKDLTKHSILGMQTFKPAEFAQQISFNIDNAWGILRCIIDYLWKLPEGRYLIQKDANKPLLRFHTLPEDVFQSDEEEDEQADDEENENLHEALLTDAQERLAAVNSALGSNKLGVVNS